MASDQANTLTAQLFGDSGQGTGGYQNIINQAYQNLGQPLEDKRPEANRAGKTSEFITNLAATFADRVLQKSGKLPTEDQVKQFVAQNATTGNAAKFETGNLGVDQMNMLSDQHLQSNPDIAQAQGQQGPLQQLQGLPQQMNSLYDQQRQGISSAFDSAYATPRKAAIEDEAALGRLRSPASIPNIAGVDTAKASGLANALASSYGNQTNSALDIGKTVATAGLQNQQFGQGLGLQNRQLTDTEDINSSNLGLQRDQLGLASKLGKAQADANKPGILDYINTGANVAKTGAGIAALFA